MRRTFIFGDMHGEFSKLEKENFPEGEHLTKEDYVIILGDFSLLWMAFGSRDESYWSKFLANCNWTTLFIDGNHENMSRIDRLPEVDMFGSKVGRYSDHIYHLKRGRLYTINDKSFLAIGGARSVDKHTRSVGITWWKREVPSEEEHQMTKDVVHSNDEVDYILSHTCYGEAIEATLVDSIRANGPGRWGDSRIEDPTVDLLDYVEANLDYTEWYYGHMHHDYTFRNTRCFFNDYKEIKCA